MKSYAILALAGALLTGCNTMRPVELRSEPTGAQIFVDDEPIGKSPVIHSFDFSDPDALYKVTAEMEGHVTGRKRVSQLHLEAAMEQRVEAGGAGTPEFVLVKINEDESWTQTATCRATNVWVEIEVNPQLGEEQVWEMIVDTVTKHYPELSNLDNEAGYVAAKAKEKRFQRGPVATVGVKNQFFCSIASRTPLIYKIKIESQLEENGRWEPFDRVFKDDASLLTELEARLILQE